MILKGEYGGKFEELLFNSGINTLGDLLRNIREFASEGKLVTNPSIFVAGDDGKPVKIN